MLKRVLLKLFAQASMGSSVARESIAAKPPGGLVDAHDAFRLVRFAGLAIPVRLAAMHRCSHPSHGFDFSRPSMTPGNFFPWWMPAMAHGSSVVGCNRSFPAGTDSTIAAGDGSLDAGPGKKGAIHAKDLPRQEEKIVRRLLLTICKSCFRCAFATAVCMGADPSPPAHAMIVHRVASPLMSCLMCTWLATSSRVRVFRAQLEHVYLCLHPCAVVLPPWPRARGNCSAQKFSSRSPPQQWQSG